MVGESDLRAAIRWTLERIAAPEGLSGRAWSTLDRCVGVLEDSVWPGAVGYFSDLNPDGCPLEFAFSSRDDRVRFTIESAPPEVRPDARLARTHALMFALGGAPPPPPIDAWLRALHADGTPVWGAALGGRLGTSGDRYKLYAEVPRTPSLRVGVDLELRAARLQEIPRLVMVGWESGSPSVERYFRSEGLADGELPRILDAAGLGDRTRELSRAVSTAWQGSADVALRGRWGISLAGPLGGPCTALSLFKEANRVAGGDARTRGQILGLVRTLDAGSLDAYERVSAPLAHRPGAGAHGMLAFTVAHGRPLELRIGLSAFAAWRATRGPA